MKKYTLWTFLVLVLCINHTLSAKSKIPFVFISSTPLIDTTEYYLELNGSIRYMKDVNPNPISGDNPWLDSAVVRVILNDQIVATEITSRRGKCSFKLQLDRIYTVELAKPGFVTKRFTVNTKMPKERRDVFEFYFDMDLFEKLEGVDVKVLDKPIAIVNYNMNYSDFQYDAAYTNRINAELKVMYRNYYMYNKMVQKEKKEKQKLEGKGEKK